MRGAQRNTLYFPLWLAAGVALFGVGLIAFSSLSPLSSGQGGSGDGALGGTSRGDDRLQETHRGALAGLKNSSRGVQGLQGSVDVYDFGDGLGLGLTQAVQENATILQVPRALVLDPSQTRSCTEGKMSDEALDCRTETVVQEWLTGLPDGDGGRKNISRLTGLLAILVLERLRGHLPGLRPSPLSGVLDVLPELATSLFAIDEHEFRVFSIGTSMEGWREVATKEVELAHTFIKNHLPLGEVALEKVQWAYLVLQAHGHWTKDVMLHDSPDVPDQVLFLSPLFLARPTPEYEHGVRMQWNKDSGLWEALAPRAMRAGDEVHFVDRRLSDASVLCFRGLWFTGRHRMQLTLNVSETKRDEKAQILLDSYGCGERPLRLYMTAQKSVDHRFFGCMRLLAMAGNSTRLLKASRSGWLDDWPNTTALSRSAESQATELAVSALQQVLTKIGTSSAKIRKDFGTDAVATRPTVKVREAETMVVVALLKSMKELQLVTSNNQLYDDFENRRGARGSG